MSGLGTVRYKVSPPTEPETQGGSATFWGWTCGECDGYHRTVNGVRLADDVVSLRCRFCGTVEKVIRGSEQ